MSKASAPATRSAARIAKKNVDVNVEFVNVAAGTIDADNQLYSADELYEIYKYDDGEDFVGMQPTAEELAEYNEDEDNDYTYFNPVTYDEECRPSSAKKQKLDSNDPLANKVCSTEKTLATNKPPLKINYLLCEHYMVRLCPICAIEFPNQLKWRQHFFNEHQLGKRENLNMNFLDNKTAICKQCNAVINSKKFSNLRQHEILHMPHSNYFKCKLCSSQVTTLSEMNTHLTTKHAAVFQAEAGGSESVLVSKFLKSCPYCDKFFDSRQKWHVHLLQMHQEQNELKVTYLCPGSDCTQRFNKESQWLQHIITKHDYNSPAKIGFQAMAGSKRESEKYQCLECKFVYHKLDMDSMRMHSFNHFPAKLFQCKYCYILLQQMINVRLHICARLRRSLLKAKKTESSPATEESQDNFTSKSIEFVTFVCPKCGQEFATETEWFQHTRAAHQMNTLKSLCFEKLKIPEDGLNYRCIPCNKLCQSRGNLWEHAVSHMPYKSFKCNLCEVPYASKRHLIRHICKNGHLFAPSDSDAKYKREHLDLFIKLVRHVCPVCAAEFETNLQWHSHLTMQHELNTLTGLRMQQLPEKNDTLKCMDCDCLLDNVAIVKRLHRFKHLPFKSYKCRFCDESLSEFNAAYNHAVVCQKLKNADSSEPTGSSSSSSITNEIICDLETCSNDGTITKVVRVAEKHMLISCSVCCTSDVNYETMSLLHTHFLTEHNNFKDSYVVHTDGSMDCKECGKYLQNSTKGMMRDHKYSHYPQRSFRCRYCEYATKRYDRCHSHIVKVHLSSDTLPSSVVQKTSAAKDILPKMSKACMGFTSAKTKVLNQFIEHITYACPECNESLSTQKDWHQHINLYHDFFDDDKLRFDTKPDGTRQCKDCYVKLPNRGGPLKLQRHRLTHMRHKAFICLLCNHRSYTQNPLIDHIRRRHFTSGQFPCLACTMVFSTSYELIVHARTHRDDEWPATVCLKCYHQFSTEKAMLVHMQTHDLHRQLDACEYCDRQYSSRRETLRHIEKMHPEQWDAMPFQSIRVKCS